MTSERLTPIAITPMKQILEVGCVPTAISMVFSGFGIEISERALVDKYFPTAGLPISAWDPNKGIEVGVTNTDTVKGVVQIIRDLDLRDQLQTDVFMPGLYEYTNSPEERYVVEAEPRALRKYRRIFEKGSEVRKFYETLERLMKDGEIGVYTANNRLMKFRKGFSSFPMVSEEASRGFYSELAEFVKKGHIVGPHGGMTMHTRALDGSRVVNIPWRPNEPGFLIVDPRGESYETSLHSLVWVDSMGVHGDVFDYLFRVSPKEEGLTPQKYGFRRFIQNLRDLIP